MSAQRSTLPYATLGQRQLQAEPVITRLMTAALEHPGILSLAAGFTDNAVLPVDTVAEAARDLAEGGLVESLQYGLNRGRPALRQAVLEMLRAFPGEAGLDVSTSEVLITNGSQQALYLTVQLLCDPGDIVLVQAPSYFVFLELLRGLGVRALSVPTWPDGRIDLGALEGLLQDLRESRELSHVKLLYLMGVFANPSARSIDETDKLGLAELLRGLGQPLPVIEDMAYRELYFGRPYPARSMLSLPEWNDLPLLYSGSFSKSFASGLKTGYVVSRQHEWIEGMARIKGHQDFGTANYAQALLERLWQRGEYQTQLKRVRPHYQHKMQVLQQALIDAGLRELGWHWEAPEGGLLMWLEGPKGFDTRIDSPFYKACLEREVIYVPGDLCFAEGAPHHAVRLSFGTLSEDNLQEAARRFVAAAKAVS
ncbi:MAG: PLP-dependent aminotransferase family protein [Verrucomicrobiota bacterium JB022]|nr:PLP-dependent aminotransferase family protein [Verrucomicrobiota bacterium JB022]